jgi:hypothetical protein
VNPRTGGRSRLEELHDLEDWDRDWTHYVVLDVAGVRPGTRWPGRRGTWWRGPWRWAGNRGTRWYVGGRLRPNRFAGRRRDDTRDAIDAWSGNAGHVESGLQKSLSFRAVALEDSSNLPAREEQAAEELGSGQGLASGHAVPARPASLPFQFVARRSLDGHKRREVTPMNVIIEERAGVLIHGGHEVVGNAAGSAAAKEDEAAAEGAAGRGHRRHAASPTAVREAAP